jgi:cleavage and polyadenylation specificity factor subunit 4
MGFCPNGSTCRYKHVKLPGPPPPVEEVLQKILQMRSFNRFGQYRNHYNQQAERSHPPQGSGLPNHTSTDNATALVQPSGVQQAQTMNQQAPQQQQKPNATDQVQGVSNGLSNPATRIAPPLPQGPSRCVWSF